MFRGKPRRSRHRKRSRHRNPAEKPQLRSHGSAAKELKVAEEDLCTLSRNFLARSEVYAIKEALDKQKAAAQCSLTQIVDESSSEDEDEDEDEEEEEEEDETCDVCLKDKAHYTFNCPYLDCIPNAKDVTVGNGFELVCKRCEMFGVHAACGWEGRAIVKTCDICQRDRLHWTSECPTNPDPQPFGPMFNELMMSKKTVMMKIY